MQRSGHISPQEFSEHLAGALAALQHKLPQRVLSIEEAAQVGAWREAHELAANQLAAHDLASMSDASLPLQASQAAWGSVLYADRALPLAAGPLNRNVWVVAVDSLDEVMALVAPQRDFLQTAGLAAAPEELMHLAERLGQVGVTRICALGAMTSPEAGWHHDGRFSLLDLVRMVDLDDSTERSAESFTRYAP